MCLLLNMLSRLVITFLPRSKCLLISWLQSPSVVVLEHKKIKSITFSTVFPSIRHEVMGLDAMMLVFWMLSFKPVFPLSSLAFIKRCLISSSLSAIRVVVLCTCAVIQLCPMLCDPTDCSLPDSTVHGILQARILEWVANTFSRGSSWPRDWTWVSRTTGRLSIIWATREALDIPNWKQSSRH